jgi:IEC3 subunit of the Ino80 complex, chromatin re-modelling
MEFNDSLHIPPNMRYDLTLPGETSHHLTSEDEDVPPSTYTTTAAKSALKEARTELDSGEITSDTYRRLEKGVKRSTAFRPAVQYESLRHIIQPDWVFSLDGHDEDPSLLLNFNYLTPDHEHEYLLGIDAKLGDSNAEVQLKQLPEKSTIDEREREANLQNPNSVYNWLRRNTPQVFLQDNENTSEKGAIQRPTNARSSKRASLARQPAKEEDMYDEDGIALDVPAPSATKGKRKREEDSGYRPKGGRASTGRKKKETDSNYSGRRASKRSSGVGA